MKRQILIAVICIISANLFSQTYKLETVFTDSYTGTYLSHWKVLESTTVNPVDTFSFHGGNGIYEVEYYKGNAKDTYVFLNRIIEFLEKYKNENTVLTYISGVQVKTLKQFGFKYTLIYDKDLKLCWIISQKRWPEILAKFVSYCDNQDISYK